MAMSKKKIMLEDGRYLICYTFGEKPAKDEKPASKCRDGKCEVGE